MPEYDEVLQALASMWNIEPSRVSDDDDTHTWIFTPKQLCIREPGHDGECEY